MREGDVRGYSLVGLKRTPDKRKIDSSNLSSPFQQLVDALAPKKFRRYIEKHDPFI